jgi:hypothetical protein
MLIVRCKYYYHIDGMQLLPNSGITRQYVLHTCDANEAGFNYIHDTQGRSVLPTGYEGRGKVHTTNYTQVTPLVSIATLLLAPVNTHTLPWDCQRCAQALRSRSPPS